jgi:hypothetical protein
MINIILLFLLSVGVLLAVYFSRKEYFQNWIQSQGQNPDPNVVQTSGMDSFNPLPFYVKYGYPDFGMSLFSPYWFYDTAFTGPIQNPWSVNIYRTY